MLAERLWSEPEFAQSWNFGPSDEDSKCVSWMVEYLTKLWGDNAGWRPDSLDNPPEDTYLKLDCSKSRTLLGWAPKLRIGTALEWIVEWYRSHDDEKAMRGVTEGQISRYQNGGLNI
jgi:CDP-glucose 4,6-dehydratase